MSDPKHPSPLDGLGERIKSAKAKHGDLEGKPDKANTQGGLALGMRIATEMASALAVGVGIGWLLDEWLGTRPWMMILFFILGAVAAFMNLMRVAKEADRADEGANGNDDSDD